MIAPAAPASELPLLRRAVEWLMGDDTGVSSMSILSVMLNVKPSRLFGTCPPFDDDDLGRCHRLLERFPEWVPRLREVERKLGASWKPWLDKMIARASAQAGGGS